MKKITSLIGFTVLIQLLGLIQACDPCGTDGPIVINLMSISTNLIRITEKGVSSSSDHTINLPINEYEIYDINEGHIRYDSLGIDLYTSLYSDVPKVEKGNILNSAYACSPASHFDIIAKISITSSEDYNQWYQAGDELSDMVLVRTNYDSYGTLFSDYNIETDYSLAIQGNMLLTFSMPPSISKSHDLTITVTTDKGDVFTEEITGLKISN